MTQKAPKHLRAATRRWFGQMTETFEFESHHLRILQAAAEAWDRGQMAREVIAKEGLTIRDRFGQVRPHPLLAVERDSRLAFTKLIKDLHLDSEPEGDYEKTAPRTEAQES